jgi:hypothetical protein
MGKSKKYNIYYKNSRVNNRPLNYDELKKVYEQKVIYKKNNITNDLTEIPVQELEIVKCIII